MEILVLVLLYYLSQNPDFTESVKPLMHQLKNSEQMLAFLGNLSNFTQTFSTFQSKANAEPCDAKPKEEKTPPRDSEEPQENKNPQSPTAGIADEFIQKILEGYFKKH